MGSDLRVNNDQACRKRSGRFGPAWALLPKGQDLLIIGVFTWKSFAKRGAGPRSVQPLGE